MLAAEENPFLLESVAHDMDAARLAFWRQRMDRAFEAVEGMGGTVHAHLERLVVVVSARFTSGHEDLAPVAWARGYNPAHRGQFRPKWHGEAAEIPRISPGIWPGKRPASVNLLLRRRGGGWVGSQMSVPKLAAGLLALAIGAAVVTALAANPEGKPEFAPMAGPQANAAQAATKSDRLVVRPKSP